MFGQGSSRFRTTEFFGVVLPGVYVVLGLALVVLALAKVPTLGEKEWQTTVQSVKDLWGPALVLLLFVSYLIGTVFRATPMSHTDLLCYHLFHSRSEHRATRASIQTSHFPYVSSLRAEKRALVESLSPDARKDLDLVLEVPPFGLALNRKNASGERRPWRWPADLANTKAARDRERIYGHWKAVLCQEVPVAFEYCQATEARTRFFGGMLWAARWTVTLVFMAVASYWALLDGAPSEPWLPVVTMVGVIVLLVALRFMSPSLDRLTTSPELSREQARWFSVRFWCPVAVELMAAGLVAYLAGYDLRRVLFLSLPGTVSTLVFLFLGRRLRQIRASELATVYGAYCAFVFGKRLTERSHAETTTTT